MPNAWKGSVEERLALMERSGRRCDGNSRHCTRSAVNKYTLLPADGKFNALPDAEPVVKKSCGYHRDQFISNGLWVVVADREMRKADPNSPRSQAKREAGEQISAQRRDTEQ